MNHSIAGDSLGDRVRAVLQRIAEAARRSGRSPERVRLIAATKTVPIERIREGIAAGIGICGESRLQEALPKIDALGLEQLRWHFIGRLQRRKVRHVVGAFEMIHSVDSLELAREIDRRAGEAGLRQEVLLEVNIGAESTKGGIVPEELESLLPDLARLSSIQVKGLMAIPPLADDPEAARPYFRRLHELTQKLSTISLPNISLTELSMGMSGDYEVAVEEGATMVRVGTAIFGTRHG